MCRWPVSNVTGFAAHIRVVVTYKSCVLVAGKVVAVHRSGADMPFLSAVASAVASAEPSCAMLLTADDGAERLVMW